MQVANIQDVTRIAIQGNPKADGRKVQKSGAVAAGAALAGLILKSEREEAKIAMKRGEKRRMFVKDIHALSHDGHVEFRSTLSMELQAIDAVGAVTGTEVKRAGYSMASFRVMVSQWRAISIGCEAGAIVYDEEGEVLPWEECMTACREAKNAATASGDVSTGKDGVRKAGAGRPAKTDYDKAWALVIKMGKADQLRMLKALASAQGLDLSAKTPANVAQAPAPATVQ